MKQLDFSVCIIIPYMRSLQNEYHGTTGCNDTDSRPTPRAAVYLHPACSYPYWLRPRRHAKEEHSVRLNKCSETVTEHCQCL